MKLILVAVTLLLSQAALAEYIQLPAGTGVSIGNHYVQCEGNSDVDYRGGDSRGGDSYGYGYGNSGYGRSQMRCSVRPAGGILYEGRGSTEREALSNLEKYCISKRQSSRLAQYCAEMRSIAICKVSRY